jgi:hypothetical protein
MEAKTKKLIYGVGSIFVAIIFIFSYGAFGNNSNASTSTTTVGASNTVFVYGNTNGIIENYSQTTYITATGKNEIEALNVSLGNLEANGTVSNYVPINATYYEAILSTMSPYQLSVYLANALNSSTISVSAYAYVRLPATVYVNYNGGSQIPLKVPAKNYTVYISKSNYSIGANVPVKMQVLVTTAGQIYNNQLRLTEG